VLVRFPKPTRIHFAKRVVHNLIQTIGAIPHAFLTTLAGEAFMIALLVGPEHIRQQASASFIAVGVAFLCASLFNLQAQGL